MRVLDITSIVVNLERRQAEISYMLHNTDYSAYGLS
jgi:hypothetical protein